MKKWVGNFLMLFAGITLIVIIGYLGVSVLKPGIDGVLANGQPVGVQQPVGAAPAVVPVAPVVATPAVITPIAPTQPTDNRCPANSHPGSQYLLLPTPSAPVVKHLNANGVWETISPEVMTTMTDFRGTWTVVVPANTRVATGIRPAPGATQLIQQATGSIKLNACDDFTVPPQGTEVNNPEQLVVPHALGGALLETSANSREYLPVGACIGRNLRLPEGGGELIFFVNTRQGEESYATGSFTIVFTIS